MRSHPLGTTSNAQRCHTVELVTFNFPGASHLNLVVAFGHNAVVVGGPIKIVARICSRAIIPDKLPFENFAPRSVVMPRASNSSLFLSDSPALL